MDTLCWNLYDFVTVYPYPSPVWTNSLKYNRKNLYGVRSGRLHVFNLFISTTWSWKTHFSKVEDFTVVSLYPFLVWVLFMKRVCRDLHDFINEWVCNDLSLSFFGWNTTVEICMISKVKDFTSSTFFIIV